MSRRWLPPLLLALYALGFAWKTLGGGLLVFDDHPGQLYRVAHAITVGWAPWRLNPGWWAGYAELQFYPPGFAYAGAALHHASLGALGSLAVYQALLWVTYLLPGAATYLLLARVLGKAWLALPGAFLALTLSAGALSGVEAGMRWGLVAARLGWGLLPLLGLSLAPWVEGRARAPLGAAALSAAVVLTHPAHVPAAITLVILAAGHAPGPRGRRLGEAALLLGLGLGLGGFWLLPLVAHLPMVLPLAWGDATLGGLALSLAGQPLLLALAAATAVAFWAALRGVLSPAGRWLAGFAPAMALIVLVDAVGAEPSGILWLPADRLVDSLLLGLILGSGLALAEAARRWPRLPAWGLGLAAIASGIALSVAGPAPGALALWPRPGPNEWPKEAAVSAGLRLGPLWETLRSAPPGRALFLRSAVPLDYRQGWRRPHTHITALTPLCAGRAIVHGTFTHPSPVAGLVYSGSPASRPITRLAEQGDGVSLFGRPLEDLGADEFNRLAEPLRVSTVVALDEDEARLGFLANNPAFGGPARLGPFRIFTAREPRPLPAEAGPQRWRLMLPAGSDGWAPSGLAWSPLWEARAGGRALPVRRDGLGLLEVRRPAGPDLVVDLVHRPGLVEWAGLALSGAAGLAWLALGVRRRRGRPGP